MATPTPRGSIGHVAEVHGPVVDIACDTLPPLHRALEVAIDGGSSLPNCSTSISSRRCMACCMSRQRLAHMEHALDRLDETVAHLALERNALRQEKIVEEIEVILSSEQAFADRR